MRKAVRDSHPPLFLVSTKAARAIDRLCASKYGISTLVLMENAATQVAGAVRVIAGSLARPSVLIVAGTGNNGGDALAAARHISNSGAAVSILLVGSPARLSDEAAIQYKTCRAMKLPISIANKSLAPALRKAASRLKRTKPDIVLDGLFGTGLSRPPQGLALEAIRAMNGFAKRGSRIVAIDIPSGLSAELGTPVSEAVVADLTVTFVALKEGMILPSAIGYLGRVVVADIGVPRALVERLGRRLEGRRSAGR